MYTDLGHPHGCLYAHAGVNCSTPEVAESLCEGRNATIAAFETRTRAHNAAGELSADTDAATLAAMAIWPRA